MTRSACLVQLLLLGIAAVTDLHADDSGLEHVIVTADFRERSLTSLTSAITVIDAASIEEAGVQHFADLVALAPNLHWAGGSSRPRYFQIRGVGEREQYEGAPNPSVGFLIDDIDFSGVGMVATLFDVERIEVLRGPQGTRYGANALAGMINVRTRAPGPQFEIHGEASAGGDETRAAGLAFGGPLSAGSGYRISAHKYSSDGFRHNATLDRDDTNGRNETVVRARLTTAAGATNVGLTLMHADIDNGFDAFSIDNSLRTLSDKPGTDAQRSSGGAVRLAWSGDPRFELQAITTGVASDIRHSFDGDWGSDASWGQYAPYDFTSDNQRNRRTLGQELRIVSTPAGALFDGRTDWLLGVYAMRLDEDNALLDLFNGAVFRALDSRYRATSIAMFAEFDTQVSDSTSIGIGSRFERRDASYADSADAQFNPLENMLGGHLSLRYSADPSRHWYLKLARGYKAGGFNIDTSIPQERRQFDSETLLNYEAGVRAFWLDGAISVDMTLFYSRRQDQQIRTSQQLDPGDPLSFAFVTGNAARGRNAGLEAQASWRIDERWQLHAALGLLETRFEVDSGGATVASGGREQAHAPGYQFNVGASYRDARGWFARVDLAGVDAYYFSDSHDQRSAAYALWNARAGFEGERWSGYLWGRNLANQTYAVRGFYFGNEPPDFADKLYIQRGDPRHVGATLSYRY